MPAGRPTKYKAEYATEEFTQAFIQDCTKHEYLISLCALACYIKVDEDTLTEWGVRHPEFSGTLRKVKQSSKLMLVNKGLAGTYNSTIAKLCLSANHGMSERNITQLDGLDTIHPVINVTLTKEDK